MRDISMFYEPRKVVMEKYGLSSIENAVEMTGFDSGFLCGVIREKKPRRIVECGIAAGGTSVIILECLKMLGLESELYSVDLSKNYYRDETKECGFLADVIKNDLPVSISYKKMLGRVLANRLNDIVRGGGIDVLVLDTTHSLPGEILDFLVALPYLNEGAYVVLHDIAYHLYKGWPKACCTQLLFHSVVGKKIFKWDENREDQYPNITAFVVNEDTKKYIENVFHALSHTWSYLLDDVSLSDYREKLKEIYSPDLVAFFDVMTKFNEKRLRK